MNQKTILPPLIGIRAVDTHYIFPPRSCREQSSHRQPNAVFTMRQAHQRNLQVNRSSQQKIRVHSLQRTQRSQQPFDMQQEGIYSRNCSLFICHGCRMRLKKCCAANQSSQDTHQQEISTQLHWDINAICNHQYIIKLHAIFIPIQAPVFRRPSMQAPVFNAGTNFLPSNHQKNLGWNTIWRLMK